MAGIAQELASSAPPDGDGEWDEPVQCAINQYNLKYGIKGFMAMKKLLCWLMSIHYYTLTAAKQCPECCLMARIFEMLQPAPQVCACLRVRGEIMGSHNCRNVGESQSVLIMINPKISPRTRSVPRTRGRTQRSVAVDRARCVAALASTRRMRASTRWLRTSTTWPSQTSKATAKKRRGCAI
jgi:hypothetical protein